MIHQLALPEFTSIGLGSLLCLSLNFFLKQRKSVRKMKVISAKYKDIPQKIFRKSTIELKQIECQRQQKMLWKKDLEIAFNHKMSNQKPELQGKLETGCHCINFPDNLDKKSEGLQKTIIDSKCQKFIEEKFCLSFNLAPIGMALATTDGHLVEVNQSLCQMVGYTCEELLQMTCSDITYPDDRPRELDLIQQLLQKEIVNFRVEKRYLTKQGDIKYAILQVILICDQQGNPFCLLGQALDITERKQAEIALRESEKRLSKIIATISDGLLVVDYQGNVCFANEAAQKIFGRSQEQLLHHPFGLPIVNDEITEISIQPSQNKIIITEMRVADLIWEGQNAYLISLRDITQSYQATEEIAKSEQKYRTIVETTTEGIWVIDRDKKTTFVNQQMAQMLGCTVEEMMGRRLSEFLYENPAEHLIDKPSQQKREIHDVKLRRQDGTALWVIISTNPLFDFEGNYTGTLKVVTNITQRKEIEQALSKSEKRLEGILNSIEDVVWSASYETWNIEYLNPSAQIVYGWPLDKLFSDPYLWLKIVHPHDKELVEYNLELLQQKSQIDFNYRIVRSDGQVRWLYSRSRVIYDGQGNPVRIDGINSDITEQKKAEAQLNYNATHDSLTQLPNRLLLMDRLDHALEKMKRNQAFSFAVLFLDLDEFKVVNDSLGHTIGDELLKEIAYRLQECLYADDTLARLGGDEFAILLEDIEHIEDAIKIAERVHQNLIRPFTLKNQEVFINTSIGIALSNAEYEDAADLLRDADTAMFRAKASGKACYAIFDQRMHARAVNRLQWETDLRRAIERQEFQVYYQPIISLETLQLSGFEALIRWQHPQQGLVSPGRFIPIAEETGLIIPMGQWILQEAAQQLKQWQLQFSNYQSLTINVNLSSKQLRDRKLLQTIDEILDKTKLNGSCLKVEITESILMENIALATEILLGLKERDVGICLDDFGTGYSSLSYLHRFPVNTLKIDRSFIIQMRPNNENTEIIRAIVSLAHILGIEIVAEGVETDLQLAQLKWLGCEKGQGYFFAKPLSKKDAGSLLEKPLPWRF